MIALKEIISYIPHLSVKCADTGEILKATGVSYSPKDNDTTIEATSIENGEEWCRLMRLNKDENDLDNEYIIPLLRPIEWLSKEIEHDGVRFIPIIELAKLATPLPLKSWEITNNYNEAVYYTDNSIGASTGFKFEYLPSINSFALYNRPRGGFGELTVPNQHELFQKLYEWQFDIHGLINKNLALPLLMDTVTDDLLSKLTDLDIIWLRTWANEHGTKSCLRKLFSKDELISINRFVKMGMLEKGHSDDKKKSVIYYMDSYVYSKF